MPNSVSTSSKRRNRVLDLGLHHFNPPSQWKAYNAKEILGRETLCAPKGQRDGNSRITSEATMDYSFFALNFLLFQCIQEAQYIELQIGNGGSSLRFLKAYGRPRVMLFRTIWVKLQKLLSLCTFPDVHGFWLKSSIYMRVYLEKSCIGIYRCFWGYYWNIKV